MESDWRNSVISERSGTTMHVHIASLWLSRTLTNSTDSPSKTTALSSRPNQAPCEQI